MNKLDLCILSGRFPASGFKSTINHRIYADKYGYDYIHCGWPTRASNPYMNKIIYLKSVIEKYDYVFWIDDDAFFFDFEKDVADFLPASGQFLSICKSPEFKELKTFVSSGQFLIKRTPESLDFIDDILNADLAAVKRWWRPDLGFFSNGDQDAIVYLLLTKDRYKDAYQIFDYKSFNSRPANLMGTDPHKVFLLHFTGTKEKKRADYVEVQKKFDMHPSLVDWAELKKYRIGRESNRNKHLKSLYKYVRKVFKAISK